jgi:hypothetical protein
MMMSVPAPPSYHPRCILGFIAFLFATSVFGCWRNNSVERAVIAVDPNTTYQTMIGWEATAEAGQDEAPGQAVFPLYKDTLFDAAVNDLGINRLRVDIKPSLENTVDWFGRYLDGQIAFDEWQKHRYDIVNDNSDPNLIGPAGFQFTRLNHQIDNVVLPIKKRLEARDEKLYVNFNYVYFSPAPSVHRNNPEEYAEFVLAVYQHMKTKYRFVPDAWEVMLEPDNNTPWRGLDIGQVIVAAGNRLKANGFTARFIAPSTTNMGNSVSFFDEMLEVKGVTPFLSELSYHRYSGVSDDSLKTIAGRAQQHGLNTSMLEKIGAGYAELHRDLKVGMNSAWQQFTLAYPARDNGAQYYVVDLGDPNHPKIVMGSRTKFLRQYFKYVRAGAKRIDSVSNNKTFDPLAFKNSDGKFVVIVKTEGEGQFSLQGLPAGTYGIKYTTSSQYDVNLPSLTIPAGQVMSAGIPEAGVMTIYSTSTEAPSRPPVRRRIPTAQTSDTR